MIDAVRYKLLTAFRDVYERSTVLTLLLAVSVMACLHRSVLKVIKFGSFFWCTNIIELNVHSVTEAN
jgi:hypothetical protein